MGQALAARLVALGMRVVATDAAALSDTAEKLGLDSLEDPSKLNDLLPEADFVISQNNQRNEKVFPSRQDGTPETFFKALPG